MRKDEAEKAIRSLSHTWFRALDIREQEHPSFSSFRSWLRDNGYGHYMEFRSTGGASEAAEYWFDQELKQTWRR
jgi:hypothetical protein